MSAIDTGHVGEHEITLKVKGKERSSVLKVVDTTAPKVEAKTEPVLIDLGGNSVEVDAQLEVIEDKEAPVIDGVAKSNRNDDSYGDGNGADCMRRIRGRGRRFFRRRRLYIYKRLGCC